MTDILIIATIITLLTVSIWLYRSIGKINTELKISTSLSPKTSIHSFLIPPITARQLLVKKIQITVCQPLIKKIQKYTLQTSSIRKDTPTEISVDSSLPYFEAEDDGSVYESEPKRVRFNGLAKIPLKVYQGDSCTITLTLNPSIRNPNRNEKPIKVYRQDDRINLTLTLSVKEREYLEVELMAAGFTVDGEKKQKQLLISDSLQYQWNCFFEKSGSHSFSFVFRVVGTSNETLQIGHIEQTVKVAKIDHLTQRQVWIIASSAGILSGILTLAEIIKNLGIW